MRRRPRKGKESRITKNSPIGRLSAYKAALLKTKAPGTEGFKIKLFCKNKMTGYKHINKIDNAEEPAPTNAKEHDKDDDMQNGFGSEHN